MPRIMIKGGVWRNTEVRNLKLLKEVKPGVIHNYYGYKSIKKWNINSVTSSKIVRI